MARSLSSLGWDSFFEDQDLIAKHSGCFPARIVSQQGDTYHMMSECGEHTAKITGKFRYHAKQVKDYPVVGDFVLAEEINSTHALIHAVLARKNFFARKMAISGGRKLRNGVIDGGITEEQVVASNIDTAFIVSGLDGDFNMGRIERYLTLVQHYQIPSVILLNKVDLCEEPERYLAQVKNGAHNIPVFSVSATGGIGIAPIMDHMSPGQTVVFVGSSGVGKSTLLNLLMERDAQTTRETSHYSGKGRHTTTHRQMFFHDSGCMIIDTPGLKELQLWADSDDVDELYEDVLTIMAQCKFSNCTHQNEPGCAVQAALASGVLPRTRLDRY